MNEPMPVNDTAEMQADDVVAQSLGAVLKRARERQSLRVEDVARELRLSVRQIEALERDDHAGLPGRTFVRGFVRHYARLAQLDQDEAVALYDRDHPTGEGLHIQAPSQHISYSDHHARPWIKWTLLGFILVMLASWGVLQWMGPVQDLSADFGTQGTGEAAHSAVSGQEDAKPDAIPVAADRQPTPVDAAKPPETPPLAAPAAEAAPQPGASVAPQSGASDQAGQKTAPLARLSLRFSGSSWVEVQDKSGKKLHSQNHEANSQAEIEGEPPLSLTIGRAPNVKLTYQGQPFDLAPHIKGDIARFTLD